MKVLAVNQYITYFFCNRRREGEIIEYDSKYSRYRVKSVYGVSWVKRKNILESEGLYQDNIPKYRRNYNAPDTPAIFSFSLE